jgi:hypothetical protein
MNKKDKRNSGRVWPKWVEKGMELYVTPFWDDWVDWRDGFRGSFSKSWKDNSKKQKQYIKTFK